MFYKSKHLLLIILQLIPLIKSVKDIPFQFKVDNQDNIVLQNMNIQCTSDNDNELLLHFVSSPVATESIGATPCPDDYYVLTVQMDQVI